MMKGNDGERKIPPSRGGMCHSDGVSVGQASPAQGDGLGASPAHPWQQGEGFPADKAASDGASLEV